MLKLQFSKAIAHLFDIKPARSKARRRHRRQLSVEPLEQRALLSAVTFSPAIDYSAASSGSNVRSVAIADINGDGNADVVTTNWNIISNTQRAGNVSVRLGNGNGNGNGSFGTATNFAVGVAPYSVAIADVNGDGNLDLVTANQSSGNNSLGVSVLLVGGTGSFGGATNLTAGTRPIGLAIADLNGDGKPDIVTANLINSVSVLLNTTTVPITTLPTSTTVTADNATYDGLAHGVTTVVSPGSAAGTTTFLYTGTGGTVYSSNVAPSNAGTYHVVASFTPANPLDFDSSTGSADYTIDKATISYTFGNAGHVYGSTVNLAVGLEVGRFFDDSNVCSVFSRDCCHEDLFEFFDAADCF